MTDVIRPNGASLQTIDTGTAYARKRNRFDPLLTEVGPGTPMGELFRRYWHPNAVSADTNSDVPTRIRMLGEDLVLFRDKEGRPGLMDVLSKTVSAVRTTAGSMIRKGTVWLRRAKRMVVRFAIRSDNLGTRFESAMASSGHTWGHLKRSPHYRGGSFLRTQPRENSSPTCILPSDTARKMRWTSTGYSRSKTHSILCMRCGSI